MSSESSESPEGAYNTPELPSGQMETSGGASTVSLNESLEPSSVPIKYVDVRSAHTLGYFSPGIYQEVYPTLEQRMQEEITSINVIRLSLRSPSLSNRERINGGAEESTMASTRLRPRKKRQAVASPRRAVTSPAQTASLSEVRPSSSDSTNDFWMDTQSYGNQSSDSGEERRPHRGLTYEEWLTSKRKQMLQHRRQRRREAHRVAAAEEMRKRMSDKCYTDWLASKQQRRPQLARSASPPDTARRLLPHMQLMSTAQNQRPSAAEAQQRFEQWERKKIREYEHRRQAKQREEAERQALAEDRRRLSKQAWERWLAESTNKPLPVPLNRGLDSLAGTLSSLHMNPHKWQHYESKHNESPKSRQGRQQEKPPSSAQRALRRRFDHMDGVEMYRKSK